MYCIYRCRDHINFTIYHYHFKKEKKKIDSLRSWVQKKISP